MVLDVHPTALGEGGTYPNVPKEALINEEEKLYLKGLCSAGSRGLQYFITSLFRS